MAAEVRLSSVSFLDLLITHYPALLRRSPTHAQVSYMLVKQLFRSQGACGLYEEIDWAVPLENIGAVGQLTMENILNGKPEK
jgi:hypothetical protein